MAVSIVAKKVAITRAHATANLALAVGVYLHWANKIRKSTKHNARDSHSHKVAFKRMEAAHDTFMKTLPKDLVKKPKKAKKK